MDDDDDDNNGDGDDDIGFYIFPQQTPRTRAIAVRKKGEQYTSRLSQYVAGSRTVAGCQLSACLTFTDVEHEHSSANHCDAVIGGPVYGVRRPSLAWPAEANDNRGRRPCRTVARTTTVQKHSLASRARLFGIDVRPTSLPQSVTGSAV